MFGKSPSAAYESTRDMQPTASRPRPVVGCVCVGYPARTRPSPRLKRPRVLTVAAVLPSALFAAAIAMVIVILLGRDAGQNLTTDTYTPFAMRPEGQYGPVWSPDGKAVAYKALYGDTANSRPLYQFSACDNSGCWSWLGTPGTLVQR